MHILDQMFLLPQDKSWEVEPIVQRQLKNFAPCLLTLVCVFPPQSQSYITTIVGHSTIAIMTTLRKPYKRRNLSTNAARKTCVTETLEPLCQGKQFCWWSRCWQQPGTFVYKSIAGELLLHSLFMYISSPLLLHSKGFIFSNWILLGRLKLVWATWIRERDSERLWRPVLFREDSLIVRSLLVEQMWFDLDYMLLPLLLTGPAV